ncbi:hypothetical protein [Mesobacillus maritimus]|uniref:Tetratricopeptide repeat protein n=1 Tax=Mesobacillus maritimus TaxID=1643336 RepID=A0ABS7K8H4_9BACI|nr:hypothetical protein [Mesobacillus maritimus]MBY0098568.1 hypothetical protein [Mesobacillus maritimus]
MNQDRILLMDQEKCIQLQAERVTFYLQGEMIEAFNEARNEVYYLFFYKSHYLTACKAKKLRRNSYIERAFKEGLVFDSPHPIINKLLSTDFPYKRTTFKSFLKKLEKLYSKHERALILTFFESFYPKKDLFHEISSIFYEYRRNGQMFLAYRIVRILHDFAPNHSLVKELMSSLVFNKYTELYNQVSEQLVEKDPIFAEKLLYAQRNETETFHQLVHCYEKDSRLLSLIALYSDKLKETPSNDTYKPFVKLLHQTFDEHETTAILEKLSLQVPAYLPIQQELFTSYLKAHKMKKVFYLVNQKEFHLNKSESRTFGSILDDLDFEDEFIHPEMLRALMNTVVKFFPDRVEDFLYKSVVTLLDTHELSYLKEWLAPFKEKYSHLQLFEKIDTMLTLNDDLDQMQTLGELYVEFKQLDKAIECFCWEMELKPNDPKPLQWLAKIYQDKGMDHEAEAFRQLCINLQKRA